MPEDIQAVYFKDLRVNDGVRANTLQGIIERCAGYAGIHSRLFRDALSLSGTPSSLFDTVGATVSGSDVSDITITKTSGAWGLATLKEEFTMPVVATFTRKSDKGAFLFGYGAIENPTTGWIVYWDTDLIGIAQVSGQSAVSHEEVAWSPPIDDSEMTVVAIAQRFSDFEFADYISIAAYHEDHIVVSDSIPISGLGFNDVEWWTTVGGFIGFASEDGAGGTPTKVGNLTMPELHRVVEWASIDPSESAAQGMNRAMKSSRIFYFVRFDGTLKVWRPRADDVTDVIEIPEDRAVKLGEAVTHLQPNHIRVQGAFLEGEAWDDDQIARAGRRIFVKKDDPNLWGDDDISQEAQWGLYDIREKGAKLSLSIPGTPLIEPQDFIRYPETGHPDSTLYRVENVQFTLTGSRKGPILAQTIECKRHYGTLPPR